ncbi:MAG: hypothetical protein CVU79_05875 [Elusimicrobia bacterium HGW-Elusimicrobia-3]|nr:MAG: hypothetical protein CVU79_05875 [Elusimicrobia bacterium HGW-Elusimicrobia-3]
MKRLVLTLCLLAGSAPAGAQVFLGAEVGPDAFLKGDSARIDTSGEDAFAWALTAEVSSSTLYAVFGSTTPEREALRYLRGGIYRQELAALLLLSERSGVPFKKLAEDLPKAGGLRGLARQHGADAMALFKEAGALKAAADGRMPLFLPVQTSTAPPAEAPPPDEKD